MRRSTRTQKQASKLSPRWEGKLYLQAVTGEKDVRVETSHNLLTQAIESGRINEYSDKTVKLIARGMDEIRFGVMKEGSSFAQQYFLNKGLEKFGEKGRDAATKELDQLYRRNCFEPILVKDMTQRERMKAQEILLFLTKKGTEPSREELCTTGNQQEIGCPRKM